MTAGLLLLAGAGCRREAPAPPPSPAPAPLAPWSFHVIGGLLVIEGEVDAPTELILRGPTLNARRHVEFGPVRWELYRPPKGEVAELRTAEGRLLARWDFDRRFEAQKPLAAPAPASAAPRPAQAPPAPPKTAPTPSRPTPSRPAPARPAPARPAPAPPKPIPAPVPPKPAPEPTRPKPAPAAPRATRPMPPPYLPPPQPPPKVTPPPSGFASTWPGAGEALNVVRGPKGHRRVCVTFDGGSTAEVAEDVLEALRQRQIRTTFFLTGGFIQRFPDLTRRIVEDGHEVGNHTWSHPHLAPTGTRDPAWGRERIQEELLATDAAFLRVTGRPMDPLWRAPYGEHTAEIRRWAEEVGYRHIYWSEGADTLDWATVKERSLYRSGHAILDRLRARLASQDGDGLIVLMHLGSGRPVEDRPARALGPFLDQALRDGWTFVTIGQYLQDAGKPAWDRAQRAPLLAQVSATRGLGRR